MGQNIKKQILMDGETGEILREHQYYAYDGFNDKGYRYRNKADFIRYFFDDYPSTLSQDAFLLLIMMAEIANKENVLVYRVSRKSKFSSIIYKPMTKEQIRSSLRFKYGKNKFDRCWTELKKHCIKEVRYYQYMVWAINPAIISRCRQVPDWLYYEFRLYLNPRMSRLAIKKMMNRLNT